MQCSFSIRFRGAWVICTAETFFDSLDGCIFVENCGSGGFHLGWLHKFCDSCFVFGNLCLRLGRESIALNLYISELVPGHVAEVPEFEPEFVPELELELVPELLPAVVASICSSSPS